MEFKEKLKKLRTENGLTQEALADAVHISRSAIAKYENGNGNPSKETLIALAVYFGVEVNDLKDDGEIKRKTSKATIKTATIIVTSVIVLGGIVTGTTFGILNYINKGKHVNPDYELRTENIPLNYYYFDAYATLYYGGCTLGHSFDNVIQPSNLIAGDVLHFDYVGKLADPIYSIPGEIDIVGRLERYHFIKTEIRNYHSDLGPIKDNLDVLRGMYQIDFEYVITNRNGTYVSLDNYDGSDLYVSIDYKRMYMASDQHETTRPIVAALYSYNPRWSL